MKAAVIVFPGSNCDRDIAVAFEAVAGVPPVMVWHGETALPAVDIVALPGGFTYGDYLRPGALATHSPIMADVIRRARNGMPVVGVCNGFQVLVETGLLPGALMRNSDLKFVCRDVWLRVESRDSLFTNRYEAAEVIRIPVAHHDGNYFADPDTLDQLEAAGRVAFRYVDAAGGESDGANPNGSQRNIAGILNESKTVLGMMPHPERLMEPAHGGTDGRRFFESILAALS